MPTGNNNNIHKKKSSIKNRKRDSGNNKISSPKRRRVERKKYEGSGGGEGENNNNSDGDVCQKDINQLLMGNPPISMTDYDPKKELIRTVVVGNDMANFAVKGWGNYPGLPPQPKCTIL